MYNGKIKKYINTIRIIKITFISFTTKEMCWRYPRESQGELKRRSDVNSLCETTCACSWRHSEPMVCFIHTSALVKIGNLCFLAPRLIFLSKKILQQKQLICVEVLNVSMVCACTHRRIQVLCSIKHTQFWCPLQEK